LCNGDLSPVIDLKPANIPGFIDLPANPT